MEISIREWRREDLPGIQVSWLDFCRSAARSDMRLKADSGPAMMAWLASRFKDHGTLGFIAETMEAQAGFLIGRVGHWESVPPVVEPRKMGIIDAVYVNERFRRQGVGRALMWAVTRAAREGGSQPCAPVRREYKTALVNNLDRTQPCVLIRARSCQ